MENIIQFPGNLDRRWQHFEECFYQQLNLGQLSEAQVERLMAALKEAFYCMLTSFSMPFDVSSELQYSDEQVADISSAISGTEKALAFEIESRWASIAGIIARHMAAEMSGAD
jgi:hypothetical protein